MVEVVVDVVVVEGVVVVVVVDGVRGVSVRMAFSFLDLPWKRLLDLKRVRGLSRAPLTATLTSVASVSSPCEVGGTGVVDLLPPLTLNLLILDLERKTVLGGLVLVEVVGEGEGTVEVVRRGVTSPDSALLLVVGWGTRCLLLDLDLVLEGFCGDFELASLVVVVVGAVDVGLFRVLALNLDLDLLLTVVAGVSGA